MAELSDVIDVTISQQTQAVTQAGFGVALIVGSAASSSGWTERVRSYSSIKAVEADFATSDPEYLAAAKLFSQDPRPSTVKIARRDANVAAVWTLTLDADLITGNVAAVTVNGETLTETYATSHTATVTALAAQIAAVDGVASATVGGGDDRAITVTATLGRSLTLADAGVTGGATQAAATLANGTPGKTIASELALISAEDNDWYGLLLTSTLEADQIDAAAWIEPRPKSFYARSDASGILAGTDTDIGALLEAKGYNRTAVIYHQTNNDFADAGAVGTFFWRDPGSYTTALKTIVGVPAASLTPTQSANARGKNVNTYETIGGVNVLRWGTMASGRYIDQTIFVDWLTARMQEGIYRLLITSPKIPYTDAGAALIEAVVREVLEAGVAAGGIDEESIVITVPRVANINANDRAARKLPGVGFSCRLTGAIHQVTPLNGVVTV